MCAVVVACRHGHSRSEVCQEQLTSTIPLHSKSLRFLVFVLLVGVVADTTSVCTVVRGVYIPNFSKKF